MSEIIQQLGPWAILDILIISTIIYQILNLVKGTKAAQILTGILVILGTFLFSSVVPLTTVNWVMGKFYSSFLVIVVILFQDEIRNALSRLGKKPLVSSTGEQTPSRIVEEVAKAAVSLASKNTGALIVFERNILLSRFIGIGTTINGVVSKELLMSIFQTTSPIHDGAVIIQNGKIAAAGCFLPLAKGDASANIQGGTRHRAAVGVSLETDALVILVSEEKGTVSLVADGQIYPKQTTEQIKTKVSQLLRIDNLSRHESDIRTVFERLGRWRG
jgi:diadenylate cyclase